MKTLNTKSMILSACMMALMFTACSDQNTSSEATIRGSLQYESTESAMRKSADGPAQQQSVDGVAVFAAQVTSNGSFQPISGTETSTNASGQFTLNVDMNAAQHIVIVAEQGGQQLMGHLSAHVENGNTYTLKPINATSTAGATVFTRLVATGNAAAVQKSDIEAAISAELASRINASSSVANQVAASLSSAASARATFISNRVQGNASQQTQAAFRKLAEAQFNYESQLASATTIEARESAFEAFVRSSISAYAETDLSVSQSAELVEAWGRVVTNSAASASAEVRNSIRAQAALVQAFALEVAVESEARAAGASQATADAIVEASVRLRAAIKASAGVQSEIRAAFEAFREEVRDALENDSSFQIEVFLSINSEVNASNGLAAAFRTAVNATTNASVISSAYATFESGVVALAHAHLNGSEAEAMARLVMLLQLGA